MELGGDPAYVSPNARLNEFQNTKVLEGLLLSSSVDVAMFDVALVEAVAVAEAKCFANWTFLAELAPELAEGSAARAAIESAVNAVMEQEEKHAGWATRTRNTSCARWPSASTPDRSRDPPEAGRRRFPRSPRRASRAALLIAACPVANSSKKCSATVHP